MTMVPEDLALLDQSVIRPAGLHALGGFDRGRDDH